MQRDVDLTPRQLIAWLRTDGAGGASRKLDWRASREFLAEPATGAGIDAEDGLEALFTVGTIEVVPRGGGPRWALTLRIEDEVGSHLPDDGSVPEDPEPLDLDAFERAFVPLDGGAEPPAEVILDVDDAAARRHFERLFAKAPHPG
jgi:hypothetical protein